MKAAAVSASLRWPTAAQHGMQPTGFASLRSARQRLMPTLGAQQEAMGLNLR
jgi:hypothetical protein